MNRIVSVRVKVLSLNPPTSTTLRDVVVDVCKGTGDLRGKGVIDTAELRLFYADRLLLFEAFLYSRFFRFLLRLAFVVHSTLGGPWNPQVNDRTGEGLRPKSRQWATTSEGR